jgi:hypothetical protein
MLAQHVMPAEQPAVASWLELNAVTCQLSTVAVSLSEPRQACRLPAGTLLDMQHSSLCPTAECSQSHPLVMQSTVIPASFCMNFLLRVSWRILGPQHNPTQRNFTYYVVMSHSMPCIASLSVSVTSGDLQAHVWRAMVRALIEFTLSSADAPTSSLHL